MQGVMCDFLLMSEKVTFNARENLPWRMFQGSMNEHYPGISCYRFYMNVAYSIQRLHQVFNKGKLYWMVYHIPPNYAKGNVWSQVRRICMLTSRVDDN